MIFLETHQFDVPHAHEANGRGERARRVLGEIHALIAQHHVHVHLVDGLRYHHARFVGSDPLVHRPLRVPLQEGVQLDVPAGQEGPRAGPSHDGTGTAVRKKLGTSPSTLAQGRWSAVAFHPLNLYATVRRFKKENYRGGDVRFPRPVPRTLSR